MTTTPAWVHAGVAMAEAAVDGRGPRPGAVPGKIVT